MNRPRRPRCEGTLCNDLEWHSSFEVTKCLNCGWRHYPGNNDDFEGILDLLEAVFS